MAHSRLILCLLLATFARESLAQGVYAKPHDLMVETIATGQASGVMTGDIAEHFTRQFRSTGTLLVDAKKLRDYKQAGCARLEVIYTKKDVDTPKGKTDAILKTQINYCKDGRPPFSLE